MLSNDQLVQLKDMGYLVLPEFVGSLECDGLRKQALKLVDEFHPSDNPSVFSSYIENGSESATEYIRESADKTHFFFEGDAFNDSGILKYPKHLALCKIGHGIHDCDPVFDRFSRTQKLKALTEELGFTNPLLAQSMYLFKQPGVGAEIACHQDASFIYTTPSSVMGFWFALEDATIENGCLRVLPGGHKLGLKSRFIRTESGDKFVDLHDEAFPQDGFVPLEVKKGTLIILDGQLPHLSEANLSETSRHAYTLHIIEGDYPYAEDNWILRQKSNPFRGFDAFPKTKQM